MKTLSYWLFATSVSLCLSSVAPVSAQTLTWQDSKASAVALARSEGKLVLLLAGRHTCGNCNYMQNTVCETLSPPIKRLIESEYVPWFCVVDTSSEWNAYASGLGGFTLPLVCCIDPENPNTYLDRTTAIQDKNVFYERLATQARNHMRNTRVDQCRIADGRVTFVLTNLCYGTTNTIEHSTDLTEWTAVAAFVAQSRATNWSIHVTNTTPAAFYRVSSQR